MTPQSRPSQSEPPKSWTDHKHFVRKSLWYNLVTLKVLKPLVLDGESEANSFLPTVLMRAGGCGNLLSTLCSIAVKARHGLDLAVFHIVLAFGVSDGDYLASSAMRLEITKFPMT
ncbi:hypothetical protein RRG08_033444 [Elysia crispata]|uniref:Uncharacterized protein n=1 Tax=Elysia crispata TaxID=231223 RepID=A0AAE1ATT9_9GAST|nr:hypothetical protein RRG08_033444 [Elysia crispata]